MFGVTAVDVDVDVLDNTSHVLAYGLLDCLVQGDTQIDLKCNYDIIIMWASTTEVVLAGCVP